MNTCGTAFKSNLARAKKNGPKGLLLLVGAIVVFSALFLAQAAAPAADAQGPGSLDQPSGGLPQAGAVYNRTHWAVHIGDTITGELVAATDAVRPGETEADVVIKSSQNGDTTVTGTMSRTTITFSWTVPANACATTIVAYGPVGSNPTGKNSNNDILDPAGPPGPPRFALV